MRRRRRLRPSADRRPPRRSPGHPSLRRAFEPRPEPLESRRLLSTIPVDSSSGGKGQQILGQLTLYGAIEYSNNHPSPSPASPNVIVFDTGPAKIALQQPLPTILQPVIINGLSAGGTTNTLPTGDDATIAIQVDGSLLGAGAEGLVIQAYNCQVDGLSLTEFAGAGIDLEPPPGPPLSTDSIGTTIWGNWIGVAPDGSPVGNGGAGIIVADSNNVIGGNLPSWRNRIENSGDAGVILCGGSGAGNLVEGNFIVDNHGDGVLALSPNNLIGVPIGVGPAGGGNVISGNGSNGVLIRGPSAQGNIVANDLIGTTADGTVAMPNQEDGVRIEDAPGNVIGGHVDQVTRAGQVTAAALNVIAGNLGEGVRIENDQGDPLPSLPDPVLAILQAGGTSLTSPANRGTANRVEGNWIGFDFTGTNVLSLLPNTDGIFISSAGNTVGGTTALALNAIAANARDGVVVTGYAIDASNTPGSELPNAAPNYNVIEGNFIGTAGGGDDYGNTLDGILLLAATGTTIGGTVAATATGQASAAGNVISGNNEGIVIAAASAAATGGQDVIEGNLIGTTAAGSSPLPNALDGIEIDGVPNNTIGGTVASAANVISGNKTGLHLLQPGATANTVWGNLIGSDLAGTVAIRNAGDGVLIEMGASNNTIGGVGSGEGNTIAFNPSYGVHVRYVPGVDPFPTKDDAILSNSIFSNGPLGIFLDGPANDGVGVPTVLDALPNKALNATRIDGTFTGQPGALYLIQFFSTTGTPPGTVEGETFIGSTTAKVSASTGVASFSVNVPVVVVTGSWITATATLLSVDPASGAPLDDTSEFSAPTKALNPFLVTTTADNLQVGSLRFAIQYSDDLWRQAPPDASSTANDIQFDIPGTGVQTIELLSALPAITGPLIIDGYSQPGTQVNDSRQLPPPDTIDDQETDIAIILVQIDGSRLTGPGAIGLDVEWAGCTIDGLVLTGFSGAAILLNPGTGSSVGDTVRGNFIGVSLFNPHSFNPIQPSRNPDANGVGIRVEGSNSLIGGPAPWDRNIIQGNLGAGVILDGPQNVVASDFVLDNGGDGVLITAAGNRVGQASGYRLAGAGNLISGNGANGVHILGPSARGNSIVNDEIGTQVGLAGQVVPLLGTQPRANGRSGVLIEDAPANTIGGLVADTTNAIAGNVLDGVTIENSSDGSSQPYNTGTRNVVEGNLIGVNNRNGAVETIPNLEDGVRIASAGNIVGGTVPAARNIIAANLRNGVAITSDVLDAGNNPVAGASILFPQPVANVVAGNFIGTVSGIDDYGNHGDGILLADAGQNTVGGTAAGAGNVVSNDGAGIVLRGSQSAANLVAGNLVGTTADGTSTMGNAGDGIAIEDAPVNTIGGTTAAAANVVAGNSDGIHLKGAGASANLIAGNFIGTNSAGAAQLGNSLDGVLIEGASGNTIGGTAAGAGNVITASVDAGIDIRSGVGNTILSNAIFSNDAMGIVLVGSANHGQVAPVVASATPLTTATIVSGALASAAGTTFLIQVFSGTSADVAGSYEGRTLVGSVTVTTDSGGYATFGLTLPATIPFGAGITATATSLATGDTSAFSTAALNAPSIAFSAAQYYASQPTASAVITITRNTGVGSSTVVYTAGPGTAIAGVDFTPITAAVSFAPGQTVATFVVPILPTQGRVGAFTVALSLSHPGGAGLGSPAAAVLTITTAPGTLQFSTSAVMVAESAGGVTITVNRVAGASGTVSVNYAAAAVSAVPGEDYVPVSGTLTFPPGATSATFKLPILGNSPNPYDAVIALTLSDPTGGASLGSPTTELVTVDKPLIITGERLTTGRRGIATIVLSFNKSLNPAQAVNLANYGFFVHWADGSGVFSTSGPTTSLSSASYDPASRSVTLVPASPLPTGRMYSVEVDGSARAVLGNGLIAATGSPLVGSSGVPGTPYDVIFGAGTRLAYTDAQGNQVTLHLRRGGQMQLFQSSGGAVQQLGLVGAVPRRSVLTGSVKRRRGGSGRTALPPITGASGVHIKLRGRPFGVTRTAIVAGGGRPFARRAWHRWDGRPIIR